MTKDDQVYFRNRAEEELAIALESSSSATADIHRKLANLYLAKVAERGPGDTNNPWTTP